MMDVDAYILIGGRSSRFGSDKAFVELDGEILASRAARITKTALDPKGIAFVAASDDQFDPDRLDQLGYPVIFDVKPGFGGWSAVHAALARSDTEWVFVLACDLPFITVEFLKLLAKSTRDELEAVMPRQADGRLQPLCAFYRRSAALSFIEGLLLEQEALPPIGSISGDLKTRIVESNEYSGLKNFEKFLININTAYELEAAARNEIP
jgi:molybdopterin-guanine dinucleotide biosynthesis protein A